MHKSFIYRHRYFTFAVCGLLGLLIGFLSAAGADSSFLSLMRLAPSSPVSIVMLFLTNALPFLIAAYAVSIDQWNIIFFLAFLRHLLWAFSAWSCIRSFGTAAWLIQPMLQFSDGLMLILFSVCCSRWCQDGSIWKMDLLFVIFGILLVAVTDCCLVSPFLAKLF